MRRWPMATHTVSETTFAVELLLAGVPLERVSVLLGQPSIKVTEKHYIP
jgi:integrase/recombinase XerD